MIPSQFGASTLLARVQREEFVVVSSIWHPLGEVVRVCELSMDFEWRTFVESFVTAAFYHCCLWCFLRFTGSRGP